MVHNSIRLLAFSFGVLKVLTFASFSIYFIHKFRGHPTDFFPPVVPSIIILYSPFGFHRTCPIVLQCLALIAFTNVLRFSLTVLSTSSFVFLSDIYLFRTSRRLVGHNPSLASVCRYSLYIRLNESLFDIQMRPV